MFNTSKEDIDRALAVEKSVKPEEMALYLDCMNGRPMSERRLDNPDDDIPGRDIRDGCILVGVFVHCRKS